MKDYYKENLKRSVFNTVIFFSCGYNKIYLFIWFEIKDLYTGLYALIKNETMNLELQDGHN